ncbi:MAG: hypothetical protein WCT33_02335 [Patescibacteria group bacterium]|jgi:hypothetical protein
MDAWLPLTKDHEGMTAGAVLEQGGTPYASTEQRLVIISGDEHEAIGCDADDTIRPSDVALGVIDLPVFLRQSN